jgi:hypothetical protein
MPVPFVTLPSRSVDRHVAAAGHAKRDHHGHGGGYGYMAQFFSIKDDGVCVKLAYPDAYYRTSR